MLRGEQGAKGGAEPGARRPRSSCYCCGGCPGPGRRLSRLSKGSPIPPTARLLRAGPRGPRAHLHPRPGSVGSGRPDSHKLPPRRSHCSPRLLPPRRRRLRLPLPASGSAAPSPPLPRARRLRLRVRRGRSAINTRGRRRRRGRASGAGGGRPRSEPSKVARGGGEGGAGGVGGERAQDRHGRLDAGPSAAREGRSGAKRAVAASTPRAPAERPQPCDRAGPAASEAGEREVKAIVPLPGPGPAPRRGEPGRRAARAAGTAGEPQPPPASGPATCAPARPAPLRPALGAGALTGRAPRAPLLDPLEPTSDPCLTWSCSQSQSLRCATERSAGGAGECAAPPGTRQSCCYGRKRYKESRRRAHGQNQEQLEGDRWRRLCRSLV